MRNAKARVGVDPFNAGPEAALHPKALLHPKTRPLFARLEARAPPKPVLRKPCSTQAPLCRISYCTTKLVLAATEAALPVLLVVACTRYVPRGDFLPSL